MRSGNTSRTSLSPFSSTKIDKCACRSSPYSKTLNVQCVSDSLSRSAGDALRKLDSMQIINPKVPFLLLHSPIVGNVDLSAMVKRHQALRREDPNVIMSVGVGIGGRYVWPLLSTEPAYTNLYLVDDTQSPPFS
jgi:hypothetical protein